MSAWNSDIKRAIHYIGKLHEDCHCRSSTTKSASNCLDVRTADLADTVNTAVSNAMAVYVKNQRAWNRNRNVCTAGTGPLTAIAKTVPGVGLGLPTPPNNPRAAPPALAVGVTPPNFPANLANLGSLEKKDIHQLAIQYNEDFGILAGDQVSVCRQKFQEWICGM